MTTGLAELLNRLAAKCGILADRYSLVKQQRDKALERCEALEQEVQTLKAALQKAETEIEYLRISHKIAPTEQDTVQTQAMLAAMIKKIDKCIAKLRND